MKSGMNLTVSSAVLLMILIFVNSDSAESFHASPLRAVGKVDLAQYTGRWYEIARYPNRFQRDCQSHTTAEYTLRDDGKLQVVNSCRQADGKVKQVRGTAKIADKETNAKLKVTFFWPFYGDYWVIGLSPDYRYAIVGEPKRKYLWILSRTPQLDNVTYEEILSQIKTAGYDTEKLIKTPQSLNIGQ
jgi:apolipoprotein D and lipocalin family protein